MNNVFALENRYPVKNCSCPDFICLKRLKDFRDFVVQKKIDIFDREWYAVR